MQANKVEVNTIKQSKFSIFDEDSENQTDKEKEKEKNIESKNKPELKEKPENKITQSPSSSIEEISFVHSDSSEKYTPDEKNMYSVFKKNNKV